MSFDNDKVMEEKRSTNEKGDFPIDEEGQKKKLKYPLAVGFIIGNEFCERFNYYGMRTILVLYLSRQLNYDQKDATVIFHVFTMMVYLMCIFGAIIADSWLGKFRTILYLSMVYVIGSVVVSIGAVPTLNLPGVEVTMIGLVLIAVGSGGIKPCVAAFGGDQFKLPEQVKQMATFFSLFYFAINSGSLISTTVTPVLREDVHCFGQTTCYSLAFGVPAVLMAISIVIFVLGRALYISKPPAGNMFLLVTKAIGTAISTRCKEKKTNPREHWLDYAERKYDRQLIDDIKVLLRILVLYIPLPIFWALFDQQGSRWTFQATRMDGDFGAIDIKPDQLQMLNPLLILILIPLYDVAFYPLLDKIGVRRPLQKLTIGGVLAGIAFVVSGIVELQLEKTYPVLPSPGITQLRMFNGVPDCHYDIETDIPNLKSFTLKSMTHYEEKSVKVDGNQFFQFSLKSDNKDCPTFENQRMNLTGGNAVSYFIYNNGRTVDYFEYQDNPDKPEKGDSEIRVLSSINASGNITMVDTKDGATRYNEEQDSRKLNEILSATFNVFVDSQKDKIATITLRQGGKYTLLLAQKGTGIKHALLVLTEPNSMNILWLIPQYVIMTLGEVMFSVTGLEFSYSQAPSSMKSVLQACWQLTVALGNLVVIIVAEAKIFQSQAYEFFLFAGLMMVDMCLFMYLAYRYRPNDPSQLVDDTSRLTAEESTKNGLVNPTFRED